MTMYAITLIAFAIVVGVVIVTRLAVTALMTWYEKNSK